MMDVILYTYSAGEAWYSLFISHSFLVLAAKLKRLQHNILASQVHDSQGIFEEPKGLSVPENYA